MRLIAGLLTVAALVTGTAAAAYDPIVTQKGWTQVDLYEDGRCAGEVGTNGKFTVITVVGFEPGENARFTLANGDMKPIDRAVRINRQGGWQEYYIPFRYNRAGGNVTITLTGQSCQVPLSFDWHRGGRREPDSLRFIPFG